MVEDRPTASFMMIIMAAIHFKPDLESATMKGHLTADQTTAVIIKD